MYDSHHELKAEDLGARVRAVRELQGAHPNDVAKAAGMSRRELQAAERGGKRLTPNELQALAKALGVDIDVLVGVGQEGELVHLPTPERRTDHTTRTRIEQSWREVRGELGDVLTSCARLVSAGSGDDVRRLIERLERDLREVKASRSFLGKLADHERDLQQVRRPQSDPQLSDGRVSTQP